MLTFGNTYLNFGGGYIANWRDDKEAVEENGWKELYKINPETFACGEESIYFGKSLAQPYVMGSHSSYIASSTYPNLEAYSGYTTQFPGNPKLPDKGRFKDRPIYTTSFASDNPNYYLIHFQIAPHIITDYSAWSATPSFFNEIENVLCSGSEYTMGITVNNTTYTISAKSDNLFPIVGGTYQRYFSRENQIKQTVADTEIEILEEIEDEEHDEPYTVNWKYLERCNGTDKVKSTSSFIVPFTVNLLIKNEPNNTNKISAYWNEFGMLPEYITSAEDVNSFGNSGAFTDLSFYLWHSHQLEHDDFNEEYAPHLTGHGNPIFSFMFKGFEIPSFGVSGCYVNDPTDNEMLNKLMKISYTSGE